MIKKLLIANRGEIALRILRSARLMGFPVVAIYSVHDQNAAHVNEADESVLLEGDTIVETYLNIPAIIKAAKDTGANAIHPGYGFLSENPAFAEACEQEGIIFVGPSSSSIKAMGNKIAAREIAVNHGVPVTPGLTGTVDHLMENFSKVGFPMLIKAAAGGGGKGMRIVRSETDLASALKSTSSEAANYFGDGTVYIERFFEGPRHIEVQILGDQHGNLIHLFERECSVQRRHQKIIEEAPSPALTPEVRERICTAAIQLAKSINYYSAGTIEFLVDNELNFYFLEMNTRIQVEHPVTEMITGVDIVKEQFRIAQGHTLSIRQDDLSINGHAIEVRVYAEDPLNNFIPSPGKILLYSYPSRNEIRMEEPKLHNGSVVFSNFDPMISKVIAHGSNRNSAIGKLAEFLPHYCILGIKTNLPYLQVLLEHPDFIDNNVHTRYIDNNQEALKEYYLLKRNIRNKNIPLSAALIYSLNPYNYHHCDAPANVWQEIGFWRIVNKVTVVFDGIEKDVLIHVKEDASLKFEVINDSDNSLYSASLIKSDDNEFTVSLNNAGEKIYIAEVSSGHLILNYRGFDFTFERIDQAPDDSKTLEPVSSHKADTGDLISPMPGRVLEIKAKEGMLVSKGDLLLIVEAMKMENNILAPSDGIIEKILVKIGDNVDTSSLLVHLKINEVHDQ